MHPLLDDPWMAARVDAAVAPYVGRLPEAEIAWMRDQIAIAIASDEKASKLMRRSRPVEVDESGEVAHDASAAARNRRKRTG